MEAAISQWASSFSEIFFNVENLNTIQDSFSICNTKIKTFKHNHGSIDVQTYRINNFAYSTDIKNFYVYKNIDFLSPLLTFL